MSRSHARFAGRGSVTAEYTVCLICAVGFVSLLLDDAFTGFVHDLFTSVWQMALRPGHYLVMVLGWSR